MTTRYRVRWGRRGKLRFLSAHDVSSVFERSLRRARLPIAYSMGFTPHPKVSFGAALPVGYASEVELLDLTLEEHIDAAVVAESLDAGLPAGMGVNAVTVLEEGAKSLGALLVAADYRVSPVPAWLPDALAEFLALESYDFVRQFKGEARTDDLRAGVLAAEVDAVRVSMRCALKPRGVRPSDVVGELATLAGAPLDTLLYERTALLAEGGSLVDEHGVREAVGS